MFDPTVTFADMAWLRSVWPRPLVVKGIQTVEDACAAVDAGADGIIVSNHGGRQLDRAPTNSASISAPSASTAGRASWTRSRLALPPLANGMTSTGILRPLSRCDQVATARPPRSTSGRPSPLVAPTRVSPVVYANRRCF